MILNGLKLALKKDFERLIFAEIQYSKFHFRQKPLQKVQPSLTSNFGMQHNQKKYGIGRRDTAA